MRSVRALLVETVVLMVCGTALALLANQISPLGLSLRRDYFPQATVAPTTRTNQATSTNATSETTTRLVGRGLGVIGTEEVDKLFHDPQYEQELIVFIDARDDAH